jgi:hypothetical protein
MVLCIHVDLVLCPTSFTPFCFKAPCQYKPLINLCPLFFGLNSLLWLRSIRLFLYFLWKYRVLFRPTFSGTQLGRKTMAWCIRKSEDKFVSYGLFISSSCKRRPYFIVL